MLKFEDITPEMIKRFWSKVKIGNPNECWPWLASKDKDGYGAISGTIKGKKWKFRSNRFSLMIKIGHNIPDNMMSLHSCSNPCCCNPLHLRVGSAQDNVDDMIKAGRKVKVFGCKHWLGKKHSQKTLSKMSISHKDKKYALGCKRSEDHKNKISLANTGRKLTEEAKLRISIANTGNKYTLGHKCSEETKEKLRKINTGKKLSKEIKIKIGLGGLGRKHSEETKAKMRASCDARKLKASQS